MMSKSNANEEKRMNSCFNVGDICSVNKAEDGQIHTPQQMKHEYNQATLNEYKSQLGKPEIC